MPPEFSNNNNISSNIKDGKQAYIKSLSIPYVRSPHCHIPSSPDLLAPLQSSLQSTKFNQPLFSANSISLFFLPVAGGGLSSPGRGAALEAKLAFREGKVHAFWKMIEGCRERAQRERREGEPLRGWSATAG